MNRSTAANSLRPLLAVALLWSMLPVAHGQGAYCPIPKTGNPGGAACPADAGSQTSPTGATGAGNPIDLTSGNKYQREVDVNLSGPLGLMFVRHYNSLSVREGVLGRGWSHTYETRLTRTEERGATAPNTSRIRIEVVQGDGRVIEFVPAASPAAGVRRFISEPAGFGVIEESAARIEQLRLARSHQLAGTLGSEDAVVWRWQWPSGRQLLFDGRGLLHEIRDVDGESVRLQFDARRRLLRANDAHGLALSFHYWDGGKQLESFAAPARAASASGQDLTREFPGRLSEVVMPNDQVVHYRYDAQGELREVRYGDRTFKRYDYVTAGGRPRLSRIYERDGTLAAQFDYDPQGYAIHSTHPEHVEEVRLQYEWPKKPGEIGTTWLTTADGQRTVYRWRAAPGTGSAEIVEAEGPGCPTCAPSNVRYERSSDGRRLTVTHLDSHGRPVARELQLTDLLGRVIHREEAAVSGGRVQAADWSEDRDYEGDRFAPTRVRTPSVVPGKVHEVILTYSPSGQPLTLVDRGWSPLGTDISHPWAEDPAPIERAVQMEYDRSGRLVAMSGPRTDVRQRTEFTYDAAGRLERIRYPDGSVDQVLSYDALGEPQRLAHSGDPVLELTWDTQGRLVEIAEKDVDAPRSVRYGYDARGRLHELTASDGHSVVVDYDAADQPIRRLDEQTGTATSWTYQDGQLAAERVREANGRILRTVSYVYDGRRRLQALQDGHERTLAAYGYDDPGADAQGVEPTRLIDALGVQTLLSYDRRGRISHRQEPDGGSTQIRYTRGGELEEVSLSSGARTSYQYDDFGRKAREDSPDRGSLRYFYDQAGNLTARVDARGMLVRYGYDAGDRLTTIRSREGVTSLAYRDGILTRIAGPWGEERYSYDAHGALVEHTRQIDGHTFTTKYRYDDRGRLREKRLPDGQTLAYHYDAGGRLKDIARVRWWWWETSLVGVPAHRQHTVMPEAQAAAPAPIRERERLYGNGLLTRTELEAESERPASSSTQGLETVAYHYDEDGRLTESDEATGSRPPAASDRYHYEYDAAGRLTGARTPLGAFAYTYDTNGNRLSAQHDGHTVDYDYAPGSNRLTSAAGVPYRYDQAGNPLQIGARRYDYDAFGRAIRLYVDGVLKAEYRYNAWGERVRKVVYAGSGAHVTYYLYDGRQLAAEADQQGRITHQYVYEGDDAIAIFVGDETYFIHSDRLGTPHAVTDESRRVVWRAEYTPFGETTLEEDPQHTGHRFTLNLRFPGQYADDESGTYYNYFRDYDPATGRYLESDPLGLLGGSLSPYAYASGNPIIYIDPFGLCWIYSQSTGQLTHVDASGKVDYTANGGYSGYGAGLNNPAMQNVSAKQHGDPAGPIPQGTYSIGPPHYSPNTGPMTMNLDPIKGTNTFGRTLFRIHGDNSAHNHTASMGCIIEPPNVRTRIADSHDNCLKVVP